MKLEDIPRRDDRMTVLERALDIMGKRQGISFFDALDLALKDYEGAFTPVGLRNLSALGPDTITIIRDDPGSLFGSDESAS